MVDPIMYREDNYVVLENGTETFMNSEELCILLKNYLQSEEVETPRELKKIDSIDERAKHLMENYFELDIGENSFLQWYIVRLEK